MEINVQVEKPSSVSRILRIHVPATEVNKVWSDVTTGAQRKAKMKGFRPGHVPLHLVKRYYASEIQSQVLEFLIEKSLHQAFLQEKLLVIGSPQVKGVEEACDHDHGNEGHKHSHSHAKPLSVQEAQDFSYEASVEIYPEVPLSDYQNILVQRSEVAVTEEAIDQQLTALQERNSEWVQVEGEQVAQTGDVLSVAISSPSLNEGGQWVPLPKDKKFNLQTTVELGGTNELGRSFEDHLVGMKVNDTKTFRFLMAEKSELESGAPTTVDPFYFGKELEVTVKVLDARRKVLPALDDEFAKTFYGDDMAALREMIRSELKANAQQEELNKAERALVLQLIEKNLFDIPEHFISLEFRELLQRWHNMLKEYGFPDSQIKEMLTEKHDELRAEAIFSVKRQLILAKVAELEKIEASESEVEFELSKHARELSGKSPRERMNARENLAAHIKQVKTLKFLLKE